MNADNIEIDLNEVLRYLGYKGQKLTTNILDLIEDSILEVKNIISPKYIYSYYPINIVDNHIYIESIDLILMGNSILNHLKQCEGCIFIASTLGNDIERLTRLYEKKDLTRSVLIDACATTAIEAVCDKLELSINNAMKANNKYITHRFSPGYGDLDISIQKDFLRVLDAEKHIGLTCSDHNILMPRKSVTAIIGVSSKPIEKKSSKCSECLNYKNCKYRRDGDTCEFNNI